MLVKNIAEILETFAPPVYQEQYDNSGLQVGDPEMEVKGVLVSLDITEAVLKEALSRDCNMIVAHHPLLFAGLKKITGSNYVERIVQQAVKNDIALYAAHTNLDNMQEGVNARIAAKLGLQQTAVLAPRQHVLLKLFTYVPAEAADKVRNALFAAGAGAVGGYSECSFNTSGAGTFRPGEDTNPLIGKAGGSRITASEIKIEVLVAQDTQRQVLSALFSTHPYEEVAYELVALENIHQGIGAGLIGVLPEPMEGQAFLSFLKQAMQTACIRHTRLLDKKISRIALCGGSGSFLLPDAIRVAADIFITGDFKYHQFFDADERIVVADIGHYESEQFTTELLADVIRRKNPNFAILLSNLSTNPVKYFC